MADIEKVIKGLEHCTKDGCRDCPYEENCDVFDNAFSGTLVKDALELLKEQKPIVIHKCGFTAQCPECQMTWMMWQPDNMRYCPGCGRMAIWDA